MCWERRRQEHAAERHPPPKARATTQTETADARLRNPGVDRFVIRRGGRRIGLPRQRVASATGIGKEQGQKTDISSGRNTTPESPLRISGRNNHETTSPCSAYGADRMFKSQFDNSGTPRTSLPPTASPLVGDSTTGSAQRTDPAFRLAESPNKIRVVPMQENGRQKRTRLPSRTRCPAVRPEGRRGGKDNSK